MSRRHHRCSVRSPYGASKPRVAPSHGLDGRIGIAASATGTQPQGGQRNAEPAECPSQGRIPMEWTPRDWQAWRRTEVGGIQVWYCRMSGLLMRRSWPLARMVFVRSDPIENTGSMTLVHILVFPIPSLRPFALTRSCVLPTSPDSFSAFGSLLSPLSPPSQAAAQNR